MVRMIQFNEGFGNFAHGNEGFSLPYYSNFELGWRTW